MLQEILQYLHNPFTMNDLGQPHHEESGEFVIGDDGMLSLPFLLDGQRFMIVGSMLNDGVYTYHAGAIQNDDDDAEADLKPETFDGCIYAMAIPPAVIAISAEIVDWKNKYGAVVDSPYQSESFGGYSYSKASDATGSAGGWQQVFGKRLKAWRKIC